MLNFELKEKLEIEYDYTREGFEVEVEHLANDEIFKLIDVLSKIAVMRIAEEEVIILKAKDELKEEKVGEIEVE